MKYVWLTTLICVISKCELVSLVAQKVKHLTAMWESRVGMIPWSRKWQATSVPLPGKSHGQRSQVGSVHGVTKDLDIIEQHHFHFQTVNYSYHQYQRANVNNNYSFLANLQH